MSAIRIQRLRALAIAYPGDWTEDRDGTPFAELAESGYAAIIDRVHDVDGGIPRDWWLSVRGSLPEALAWLADEILDGEIPIGVIDLDIGAPHGIHVQPPIVSDIGGEGAPPRPVGRRALAARRRARARRDVPPPATTGNLTPALRAGHVSAYANRVAAAARSSPSDSHTLSLIHI